MTHHLTELGAIHSALLTLMERAERVAQHCRRDESDEAAEFIQAAADDCRDTIEAAAQQIGFLHKDEAEYFEQLQLEFADA